LGILEVKGRRKRLTSTKVWFLMQKRTFTLLYQVKTEQLYV